MAFTKTAGVEYGTPAVVLSTTAAAGSNQTAIRTDGQLIAFDAVVPANISDSAGATGSAALASRRDHVHFSAGAGGDVAGPGSSVDNEIARFSGTTGKVVQAYTSDGPTVSDDGIITLASGSLTFSASGGTSADQNTMNFFEEGNWTPILYDPANGEEATTATYVGRYQRIGRNVQLQAWLATSSLGSMVTSNRCAIKGIPFTSEATANNQAPCFFGAGNDLNVTAGQNLGGVINPNDNEIKLRLWDVAEGSSVFFASEWSSNGNGVFAVNYEV